MEQYRSEEEQVEALKKWWEENGRSTLVAIIVALGLGFGWQGWQKYQRGAQEQASNSYQGLLQVLSDEDSGQAATLARDIKAQYSRSTYAQFAALYLAKLAVDGGNLAEAETELRWVLGRAESGSDLMQVAQLRLARVLAAAGDPEQALSVLDSGDPGTYGAAYQVARGDIMLLAERRDEALEAYSLAVALASGGQGQLNLAMLQQKLQSLTQRAPRDLADSGGAGADNADVVNASVEDTEN